ncbi:hypothetical protein H2199_004326 [Coniosporium tulheliwenetii]|uniref:Uncharacterized protein n=1 Tax=Coniosporium tulheliwenetii TaxID=3383036 RepID=A0ACC2Z512_9PEZI|nr:hypothetical protein H2199_004326 [Cladosporium sp. JES 115]
MVTRENDKALRPRTQRESRGPVSEQSSQRPITASSTSSSLPSLIPPLLSAIEAETAYAQDAFQATTCLGWMHWVLDEPNLTIVRLPRDISAAVQGLSDSGVALQEWTKVCIVKAAYLKGISQERNESSAEAFHTYSSIMPYLSYLPSLTSVTPQFRLWTERLLTRLCLLWSGLGASQDFTGMGDGLRIFRVWDRLWDGRAVAADTEPGSRTARRLVWKTYYDLLSSIIQRGFATGSSVDGSEKRTLASLEPSQYRDAPASRLQLRAELNRVEVTYESLLLQETHFPRASERNEEIESWVEAVVSNWRVLCGPGWQDEELGEGGKESVARGVLDMLYRAATKTFHSTQILRYLFTVHASLAEFDLAFKAFSSYVEIVTRSKDRAEKSGEEDDALDDDDTILRTSAEAVRLLCRFGNRKEVEKAVNISKNIQKWLRQRSPAAIPPISAKRQGDEVKDAQATETTLSSQAIAIAYRAIGISQAHWARLTYDIASRPTLQAQAAQSFRKALEPPGAEAQQLETLYCLGLLLAEMRDVAGAVRVVKQALTSSPGLDAVITTDGVVSEGSAGQGSATYARARRLVSLWHLLALLLSARSEFDTASDACEAALDQFGDPTNLFEDQGEPHQNHNGYSNHILSQSVEDKAQRYQFRGLVNQMEPFEREGIIQLKLTQLALVEALEGSNAAVDGSDELLALYARLFGETKAGAARQQMHPSSLPPPRSATSSVRSSIFGRHSTKSAQRKESNATSLPRTSTTSGPPENPPAPTIQITDEHGGTNGHHHNTVFRHKSHRDQGIQRSTGSLKLKKKSTGSLRKRNDEASAEPPLDLSVQQGIQDRLGTKDGEVADEFVTSSTTSPVAGPHGPTVESAERPLRPIAHNVPRHAQPLPVRHARQPPRQDTRLPAPLPVAGYSTPEPRFPSAQERRHKISLLVKVWLFIAGLYTRATMYEDASGAVDEAFKLAEGFELELAHESSSSRAFADKGWGGGQSVEQLWADRGELALAQTSPHHALTCFEKALAHCPHHPAATVGLSNILLDVYCRKVPAEPPETAVAAIPSASASPSLSPTAIVPIPASPPPEQQPSASSFNSSSPEELNRLAARDRAYGLLSSLTKLGSGWDYTEAWFALARAYEEGGQIEKAKEVLWWCVELEDTRPIRSWHSVGMGGYVL